MPIDVHVSLKHVKHMVSHVFCNLDLEKNTCHGADIKDMAVLQCLPGFPPPEVILYNCIISACEKQGKWQHALLLLAKMEDKAFGAARWCSEFGMAKLVKTAPISLGLMVRTYLHLVGVYKVTNIADYNML